jgi:glycosyltransferase involved in cell wall biosynthesis
MNGLQKPHPDMSFRAEPLVSAVITTYNRPALLLKAIQSVQDQTYRNVEIIVVDDCSPTDIAQVVAAHDRRVAVVRNAENKGAGYSRNAGIDRARGEIIAFLDDDDEWLPAKLEEQVSLLHDADACLCGYRELETGKVRTHGIADVTPHHLRQGNLFCGASGLAAWRHVFDKIRFDETLWSGQDWDTYVQIVQEFRLKNVCKPLFVYRRADPQSLSNQREDDPKLLASWLAKLEKNRVFLGEFHFGVRVAGAHLRFIGTRRGKIRRVVLAMRKAGVLPTLYYLYQKIVYKDGSRLLPRGTPPLT